MKTAITLLFFCVFFYIVQNPKIAPEKPTMIIESFGTIPAAEAILPEDTIRFYPVPDSVFYSAPIEIINPFYTKKAL